MSLVGDERGIATIEFAALAPALIFGLMATADIGFAVHERMTLDHVLRAGAQSAMQAASTEDIIDLLEATALKHFTLAGGDGPVTEKTVAINATRFCACPEDVDTTVPCSTTCGGSLPTAIFYEVTASKSFNGMILPELNLTSMMQIQYR